jgi:eukaryotic-like serine/threonine-protein kinase
VISEDTATHDPREPAVGGAPEGPGADTMEARYRIDRVIASGGMGVVVAATHRHLGTRVAIKLLHEATEDTRQRFLREAKLAARFDSPHVARVRDYGLTAEGQPFLVMDHLEGRTLKARIDAGPDDQREVLRLGREIVAALVEVHKARIVHRDVKPSNIFLVRDEAGLEHVKLIDFGIAKRISDDGGRASEANITRTGEVVGTVSYMAAEQMRGSMAVDQRADIFSLGAVLYEMLTGHRAFDAQSRGYALAMSAGQQDVAFAPLASLVSGLDPGLEAAVSRCLAFDPGARFQSAAELLSALPSEISITATTGAAAALSARTLAPKRQRLWPWALGTVAVVAGAFAGFLSLRDSTPAAPAAAAASSEPRREPTLASAPAPVVAPQPEVSMVAASAPPPTAAVTSEPRVRTPTFTRPAKPTSKPRFDERQ